MIWTGKYGSATWITGLLVGCAAARIPAADVGCCELSLELPDSWRPSGRPAADSALPGMTILSWEREQGGAKLTLTIEMAPIASRAEASRVRREIPRIVRASSRGPDGSQFRLRDMTFVKAGGTPAYRIRGETSIAGVNVEQIQHVVPAREKTFFVTFAWEGALPGGVEAEIEAIAGSIRIAPEPALMDEASAGALCALLGLLAGIGAARKPSGRESAPMLSGRGK